MCIFGVCEIEYSSAFCSLAYADQLMLSVRMSEYEWFVVYVCVWVRTRLI